MEKIITFYLPQFHRIPENDKWWGEGFTEWENVKKAKALFDGHKQPVIPQNGNYYDLMDVSVMRWQAEIARKNGIYGFCFYHYWFGGKLLLEKPLLNWLNSKDIDMPFCLCWANESWTNGWAKAEDSVIMEQKYGDEKEWKEHFEFLLPFLIDNRYIKENNKPLIVIYRPYLFDDMKAMLRYWNSLAIEAGFDGIVVASQRFEEPQKYSDLYNYLDYHIEYQPGFAKRDMVSRIPLYKKIRQTIQKYIYKHFNLDLSFHQRVSGPIKEDYDKVWEKILSHKPDSEKAVAGAFVNWDNTPRHNRRGTVYVGVTPEKFEKYMSRQIKHIRNDYSNEYLFVFAWNEWGEGGYLEPDEKNGDAYLKAINKAVMENKK